MSELKVYAPTYYGDLDDAARGEREEYDDPHFPIIVRPAAGVRIVLGTHDYFDSNAPEIRVERRANGWVIFLHPIGGGDPSGGVFLLDDGLSLAAPEIDTGGTRPIKMVDWKKAVSEVDKIVPKG